MSCVSDDKLQQFRDATADFLDPVSDADYACNFNLCDPVRDCTPVQFKCSFGPESVTVTGTHHQDIQTARMQCAGSEDVDVEPVGGQGGMIVTPIRDDAMAEHNFHRKRKQIENKKSLHILLGVMVLVAVYLSLR